ncbi:MAG TPA: hypothetical protein VD995_30990 [Azospirillum sp.]|nr:hypothetical protein [Azospirillum sp.]
MTVLLRLHSAKLLRARLHAATLPVAGLLMLVLAYRLLGDRMAELIHRSPDNIFLAVTAALFLALWTLTFIKMRRWRLIVACAERELSGDGLQNALAGAKDGPNIDAVRAALSMIAAQAKGLGGGAFERRIATLRRLIDFHTSTNPSPPGFELIGRALAQHDTGPGEAPDLRALDHTLVAALLFIGIIGTFFGLITFLDSENFRNFAKHSSGPDLFDHLPNVMQGLGTAFWTSLFAYVFYLVGRFVMDLCDEEYELSMRAFLDAVQGGLACLFPTTGRATVDLSAQSVELLAGTVQGMKETAEAVRAFVGQSKAVADRLAVAAAALMNAVNQAAETSQAIFASIAAGQQDWRTAAAEWRAATEAFVKAAGPLTDSIRMLLTEVHAFPSELGKQAQAMAADLGAAAKHNADSLSAHAQAMGDRLDRSAACFADRMDAFSDQLRERIGAHETILQAVTGILDEVHQQRRDMADKLECLHQDSLGIRNGTLDAVREMAASDSARTADLQNALHAMTHKLDALLDRMELLRRLQLGDGTPDDLLSTLRALRDASGALSVRSGLRVEAS